MSERPSFCTACHGFQFCGLHSSVETNLRLMPPEHLAPIILSNEAFAICPNQGVLKVLLELQQPEPALTTPTTRRQEINLPRFETEHAKHQFWSWLAGTLELSGSVTFSKHNRKNGPYYRPTIRVVCEKQAAMSYLTTQLQVSAPTHRSKQSDQQPNLLYFGHYQAAAYATELSQFAVRRKPEYEAFVQWQNAASVAEQQQIAVDFQTRRESTTPRTTEQYMLQLKNPSYLAGLIDWRGNFYDRQQQQFDRRDNHTYQRRRYGLTLHSPEPRLLDALHDKFIGFTPQRSKTKNSWTWRIESYDFEQLMEYVGPYLRLQTPTQSDSTDSI